MFHIFVDDAGPPFQYRLNKIPYNQYQYEENNEDFKEEKIND